MIPWMSLNRSAIMTAGPEIKMLIIKLYSTGIKPGYLLEYDLPCWTCPTSYLTWGNSYQALEEYCF